MSEMIERVVKAIKATDLDCASWGDEVLSELVVAVIRAMREPTEAMLNAVDLAELREGYSFAAYECMEAKKSWPVMIDAALADTGPSTA